MGFLFQGAGGQPPPTSMSRGDRRRAPMPPGWATETPQPPYNERFNDPGWTQPRGGATIGPEAVPYNVADMIKARLGSAPPRTGYDQVQGRIEKGAWNDPWQQKRRPMAPPMGGPMGPPPGWGGQPGGGLMPQPRPMPIPGVGTAPRMKQPMNWSQFGQPMGFGQPQKNSVANALRRG